MRKINVGIIGATGAVGTEFIKLLEQRQFPVAQLRLFASDQSVGKQLQACGATRAVEKCDPENFKGLDLIFVAGGDDLSRELSPVAAKMGAFVVDNSAAFRMDEQTPLVVPEVNGALVRGGRTPRIIANPNCSTIQLVLVLAALQKVGELESVQVATYQSVSGAGTPGVHELRAARDAFVRGGEVGAHVFPHPILDNCIPQIGSFNELGLTSEEEKIRKETKKILNLPHLPVSVFAVRVPVQFSHSEAVWAQFKSEIGLVQVSEAINQFAGLALVNDWSKAQYPLAMTATGKDETYVGRLHLDPENKRMLKFWVVSDNLRKGAALNGIQIAETIFDIA